MYAAHVCRADQPGRFQVGLIKGECGPPSFSISPCVIHHELDLYTISDAIAEIILLSSCILNDTLSLPISLVAANLKNSRST